MDDDAAGHAPGGRSRRRSGAEVRAAILAAARDAFEENGYARTSTRDIATRAGVVEALLFRHFGSKAGLFDAAVFEPLQRYVSDYWDHWSQVDLSQHDARETGRDWVGGMFDVLHTHRKLVLAYFAAQAYEPEVRDAPRPSPFRFLFDRNERMIRETLKQQGSDEVDPALLAEFTFGLVLAVTMMEELLPRGRRHSRRRLVAEISEFVARSIAGPS